MSHIGNDMIKDNIEDRVIEDLNSLKMDMDILGTFTQEEYDLLVYTLADFRWKNYRD
tara:strand:- start:753 stop:923 length:171 start_codon:yes stop_codon:yes gene_type:complete